MALNFGDLRPQTKETKIVEPIALFRSLRVNDASVNDLWLAQGDALREWHEQRAAKDISISLNTGAGKTLVGLLMAQSLVNETRGLVLYACSSIQLVRQTEAKAQGYGIACTTYHGGEFSNDLAQSREAFCITTYQALFNGRSIFARQEIAGIIFDDAHAAEHLLRDHFTLTIIRSSSPDCYASLIALFRDYFVQAGKVSSLDEIVEGGASRLLLVHPSETRKSHHAVLAALRAAKVDAGDKQTSFAWNHLKDHIDLCAFLIGPNSIAITPPFLPVRTLPYFSKSEIRRIYLSATFVGADAFIRTFGRPPQVTISPKTTAGECERMILVPRFMPGGADDIAEAKTAIASHKALILTPNSRRAEVWADVAPAVRENVAEAVEEFKASRGVDKLLLTARYDGVDLPGDTCRVVVIDDLPTGMGPLERYLWEYLGLSSMLRTAVTSRIVQSFGRISRGMSDHGVAIITGKQLVDWLRVPRNMEMLPLFLQKQLRLGSDFSKATVVSDVADAVSACIGRDPRWVEAYESYMRQADAESAPQPPAVLAELAAAEVKFAEAMWQRNFNGAVVTLQATLDESSRFSATWNGWHRLWVGFAFDCAGDQGAAATLYRNAFSALVNIPRPVGAAADNALPEQALRAALNFDQTAEGRIRAPKNMERDLAPLISGGSSAQTEEALRKLGEYLGFPSSRPDQEHGTGPDVVWCVGEDCVLCADAKTDKRAPSQYTKEEFGQLADHVQWTRQNHPGLEVIPLLIGPELRCSDTANPAPEMRHADIGRFADTSVALIAAYKDISATATPATLSSVTAEQFQKRALLRGDLLSSLRLNSFR